jgi:hypothetical protein
MDLLTLAAVIFGLAALGGLTLAGIRLGGAPRPPTWMALGHGAAAATGVLLLIYAQVTTGLPQLAQYALGAFVLAAIGGVTIFLRFHQKGLELPLPFIAGHALVAVTGFVLLLTAVLQG